MFLDPSGFFLETVFDILSVGWSAYEFIMDPSWGNFGWLALDVVCAFIPFVPGISKALKAGSKIDDAIDVGKAIDKSQDIIVIGNGMQRVIGKADDVGAIFYQGYDALNSFSDMVRLGDCSMVPIGVKLAGRVDNARWLLNAVQSGYSIIDIGRDGRTFYKYLISAYAIEKTMLFLWQYGKIGGHLISAGGKLCDYFN